MCRNCSSSGVTLCYYFKAGSISVRSVAGSSRFCIVTGSTVTITSSVGDTYASRTWPALRCSVRAPHYHVRMDYRLSLIERDIAAHSDHFVLALDGNLLVHLALGVEPSDRRPIECSNSGEMGARNVILLRKLQHPEKASSPW